MHRLVQKCFEESALLHLDPHDQGSQDQEGLLRTQNPYDAIRHVFLGHRQYCAEHGTGTECTTDQTVPPSDAARLLDPADPNHPVIAPVPQYAILHTGPVHLPSIGLVAVCP